MPEKQVNPIQIIVGIIIVIGLVWYFYGGGLEKQAAKALQKIENQVADDAVKQYGIASRSGTAMDVCVQAGFVTAAYLQAKDESNYRRWKEIEKTDCEKAGLRK